MLIKIFGAPYFRMLYGPPMSYGTDHCVRFVSEAARRLNETAMRLWKHTEENQTWQSYIRLGWRARRDLNPQPSDPKFSPIHNSMY